MTGLRSRAFVLCFAANLAQSTAFFLFLHFPGHVHALGADVQDIGWLAAGTAFAAMAISPLVGSWLDRGKRKRVLLMGLAASVVICGAFLLANALPLVFALRFAHGATETLLAVAFITYAADLVPEAQRARGYALFGISAMAAVGLGALLGDAALAGAGYASLFSTALLLTTASMILTALLPAAATIEQQDAAEVSRGWWTTLRYPPLLGVWLLIVAFFFSMIAVFVFLKTWVQSTGIGSMGLFFTIYAGTAIVLRVVGGGLPDRLGYRPSAMLALLFYATGLATLSIAGSTAAFSAAALLCGVGHGFGYPSLLALTTSRAGPADQGSAIAIFNVLDDGAALAAGPALGAVVASFGYPVMFASAAGAIVAGTAAAAALLRRSASRTYPCG